MIDRATQMQLDDPAAAGALWAEIDRAIVDQAPYVWLVNPIAVEFVSERVGNYQYSHAVGHACSISSGFGSPRPASSTIHDQRASLPACLVAQEFGG